MKNFTVLCALVLSFSVYGQAGSDKKIDSLERLLQQLRNLEKEQKHTETFQEKIEVLCALSKAYDGIDSTKTFDFANKALTLSNKMGYDPGKALSHFTLGRGLMYSDPKAAFKELVKGKEIADELIEQQPNNKMKSLWANGVYNLAVTYGYLGQDKKEIMLTDQVLPIQKALGDNFSVANIYTNLGIKYLNLGNYGEAKKNLLLGREIYKELGDPQEATFNLIQLAMAYENMDSLVQTKRLLDQATENLLRYPNTFDQFHYHLEASQYHLKTNQHKKALSNLGEAMDLIGNDKNSIQYGLIVQRMSRIYEEQGDYSNARKSINGYLKNVRLRNNGNGIFQGLYKRSQINAALSEHKSAYEDLLEAVAIYDSLEVAGLSQKMKELEVKYETAEKEKEILVLQNENNLADLAIEKQRSRNYLYVALIGSLAFFALIGYFFYRNKLKKVKRKERVREAEVQLLKQEQQNKIFSAMIEGQEKERKRLAIDLHDGLGGRLSGISLNLSKLDRDEPNEYPKKQLQKVMKDLDGSLQELRNIARNLMPETLVKFGLQAALKDYCSSMTGEDTKVTLQFYGGEKDIDLNQQVTIYRVIQELMNNAIKHANASEILVQYMREGDTINITVEDNGVGFSKETTENEGTGMGLSNLRTRVAYLKGELDVHSEKNEGTTVNVHITIDAA